MNMPVGSATPKVMIMRLKKMKPIVKSVVGSKFSGSVKISFILSSLEPNSKLNVGDVINFQVDHLCEVYEIKVKNIMIIIVDQNVTNLIAMQSTDLDNQSARIHAPSQFGYLSWRAIVAVYKAEFIVFGFFLPANSNP